MDPLKRGGESIKYHLTKRIQYTLRDAPSSFSSKRTCLAIASHAHKGWWLPCLAHLRGQCYPPPPVFSYFFNHNKAPQCRALHGQCPPVLLSQSQHKEGSPRFRRKPCLGGLQKNMEISGLDPELTICKIVVLPIKPYPLFLSSSCAKGQKQSILQPVSPLYHPAPSSFSSKRTCLAIGKPSPVLRRRSNRYGLEASHIMLRYPYALHLAQGCTFLNFLNNKNGTPLLLLFDSSRCMNKRGRRSLPQSPTYGLARPRIYKNTYSLMVPKHEIPIPFSFPINTNT